MSKKKMAKCYIYLRVSTSMQVEGYSLDAQRDRLQKFAEFQNIEIVREYCDAGKSGKSVEGRPEFTRMLKDIEKQWGHPSQRGMTQIAEQIFEATR